MVEQSGEEAGREPLSAQIERTLSAANDARDRAYAPYSQFYMGAAVLTADGQLVPGALVENVSLGLAMCAERVALFSAVAQGAGQPRVLALSSRRTSGDMTWPCGACLQVALELAGPELIVAVTDGEETRHERLGALAPRMPQK